MEWLIKRTYVYKKRHKNVYKIKATTIALLIISQIELMTSMTTQYTKHVYFLYAYIYFMFYEKKNNNNFHLLFFILNIRLEYDVLQNKSLSMNTDINTHNQCC